MRVTRRRRDVPPAGPDGRVPPEAMAQRFQARGDVRDLDSTDGRVLRNPTPEELVESGWWDDPSVCDVEGVDTRGAAMYDVSSVPKSKRSAQRRMAVIADEEEARRIRAVLSESFTAEELAKMAEDGAVVVRSVPDCGDATGVYFRRQDGVETPLILLERGVSADGVVHEFVHHLKASDRSREGVLRSRIPSRRDGTPARRWRLMPDKEKKKRIAEDERATVAETVARTGRDPSRSGYYDSVPGKNPDEAYEEDLAALGNRRRKGRAAERAVDDAYESTNIAMAEILAEDVRKRRRRKPGGGHRKPRR